MERQIHPTTTLTTLVYHYTKHAQLIIRMSHVFPLLSTFLEEVCSSTLLTLF